MIRLRLTSRNRFSIETCIFVCLEGMEIVNGIANKAPLLIMRSRMECVYLTFSEAIKLVDIVTCRLLLNSGVAVVCIICI